MPPDPRMQTLRQRPLRRSTGRRPRRFESAMCGPCDRGLGAVAADRDGLRLEIGAAPADAAIRKLVEEHPAALRRLRSSPIDEQPTLSTTAAPSTRSSRARQAHGRRQRRSSKTTLTAFVATWRDGRIARRQELNLDIDEARAAAERLAQSRAEGDVAGGRPLVDGYKTTRVRPIGPMPGIASWRLRVASRQASAHETDRAGHCLCGAISVHGSTPIRSVQAVLPSCTDCQRQSRHDLLGRGAACRALRCGIEARHALLVRDRPARTAGTATERRFCSDVRLAALHLPEASPEVAYVKVGSLDDPSWLERCRRTCWTGSAQSWSPRFDDAMQFETPPGLADRSVARPAAAMSAAHWPIVGIWPESRSTLPSLSGTRRWWSSRRCSRGRRRLTTGCSCSQSSRRRTRAGASRTGSASR